jgi:hypothetical protein
MMIEVSLFNVEPEGEIVLPMNPNEQDYVELTSMDNSSHAKVKEGNVYISRIFELKFK